MVLWIGLLILFGAMVALIINHETGTVVGFEANNFAVIAQYSALTILISAGVVAAYRHRFKEGLRHALIWVLMLLALVAVYGFRHDLTRIGNQILAALIPGFPAEDVSPQGDILITLRQRTDGHFVADMKITGISVRMLVDTGASSVVLTAADAKKIGLTLTSRDYSTPVSTANGIAMAAPIRLQSLAIGSLQYRNVPALVAQPGALTESLLGNSFLERLVSYEVRGDTLVLRGRP